MVTLPTSPSLLPPLPRPQDPRNTAAPFAVPPATDEQPAPAPAAFAARRAEDPPAAAPNRTPISAVLATVGDRFQPFMLYPAPLGAVPLPVSAADSTAATADSPIPPIEAVPASLDNLRYRNGNPAFAGPERLYTAAGSTGASDRMPPAGQRIDERA